MNRTIQTVSAVHILLVEDSKADIRLTAEVFAKNDSGIRLHVATDGEAALNFLRRREEYSDVPVPDLILLDLNIPRIDGRTVLKEIKEDDFLRNIPVIVLSTSQNESDINTAYRLHANAYVVKPISIHDFTRVIDSIRHFWIEEVVFPEKMR